MDDMLRHTERNWAQEPTLHNWISLLRVSELAGQPRFTQEALVTALGPGEVTFWEYTPTGFKAKIRNGIYPHRKHTQNLTTNDGYPTYEIHEDWETVRDDTNWDGWLKVIWGDDEEDPELQIRVASSWQFGPEEYPGTLMGLDVTRLVTRDYRYVKNSITNNAELDAALFDYEGWEQI